jgi:accessory colonization factor AcfC
MGAEFGVANGPNKQKKKRGKKVSDAADLSSESVQVCVTECVGVGVGVGVGVWCRCV